jgi:hypothetical protein
LFLKYNFFVFCPSYIFAWYARWREEAAATSWMRVGDGLLKLYAETGL